MLDLISVLIIPFGVCLVLAGMHAYLGLHVIDRGVIFLDLALAQVAALGAAVAYVSGFNGHDFRSYGISLCFALGAASLFSWLRPERLRVSLEAVIGITYAVSAAAIILVIKNASSAAEDLSSFSIGHLLFTDGAELKKLALLYGLIGILHFIFRKQIFSATNQHKSHGKPAVAIAENSMPQTSSHGALFWADLLFYSSFAVVITSSVEVAGVLLVFSYLIVPSVCGTMLAKRTGFRLALAWTIGTFASVFGMTCSAVWDLPTAPTIVCAFGGIFAVTYAFATVRRTTSVAV